MVVKRDFYLQQLIERKHNGLVKVIYSAFAIPDAAKREQETFSLRRSGDFFRKVVVTAGSRRPQE